METTTTNTAKTIEQIIAEERAAHAEWESATIHGNYTIAELRTAFELVSPANWKDPIKAIIRRESAAKLAPVIVAAIAYFVGGAARIEILCDGSVEITDRGYYANIGA